MSRNRGLQQHSPGLCPVRRLNRTPPGPEPTTREPLARLTRHTDGRYACGEGGVAVSTCRQIGKTFIPGTAMFLKCILRPGSKVIWTAYHTRTSDETFADLCDRAFWQVAGGYNSTDFAGLKSRRRQAAATA
ncbi:hypothetical protein [Bifidobacterium sp. SO4]|uniref:hypothetical protein n=1 Tax=Bifidobacterium sp. SO4 TaxID=2809030 RepID=UPI001BDD4DFC|nr:hypothetical protein [Bifidobacterium sp. SO4]MBT1170192.1 hypothetical protein [Bifidobacterium sp. SO4]